MRIPLNSLPNHSEDELEIIQSEVLQLYNASLSFTTHGECCRSVLNAQVYCTGVDEFLWLCKLFLSLYETIGHWKSGQRRIDLSKMHPAAPARAHEGYKYDVDLEKVHCTLSKPKEGCNLLGGEGAASDSAQVWLAVHLDSSIQHLCNSSSSIVALCLITEVQPSNIKAMSLALVSGLG